MNQADQQDLTVPTTTEKNLCRIWAQFAQSGQWFDAWQHLAEIAQVLKGEGECCREAFELFDGAAFVALSIGVEAIHERAAA